MIRGSQTQKGGEGSQQIQVAGDLVLGIDEERARQIATATARQIIAEHTDAAIAVVQQRVEELDRRVIENLDSKGKLDAFGDPAFQRAFRKAQSAAAASDREADYDTLAALLASRAETGNRRMATTLEKAVEVVDLVDDEALRALTVLYGVQTWTPMSPIVSEGLDALDRPMGAILDGPLPADPEWAGHLESLGLVRLSTIMDLKKIRELYPELMIGYVASGAALGSFPDSFAVGDMRLRWEDLTLEHELKPGFRRVRSATVGNFRTEMIRNVLNSGNVMALGEIDSVVEQAQSIFGLGVMDPSLVDPFLDQVRSRPNLATVTAFWDTIPMGAQLTSVGSTLALANAVRLDPGNLVPRQSDGG